MQSVFIVSQVEGHQNILKLSCLFFFKKKEKDIGSQDI